MRACYPEGYSHILRKRWQQLEVCSVVPLGIFLITSGQTATYIMCHAFFYTSCLCCWRPCDPLRWMVLQALRLSLHWCQDALNICRMTSFNLLYLKTEGRRVPSLVMKCFSGNWRVLDSLLALEKTVGNLCKSQLQELIHPLVCSGFVAIVGSWRC